MANKTRFGALAACIVTALGTTVAAGAQPTAPCEQDARHRVLDFWVGEWQVVDGDGQAVGTNRIDWPRHDERTRISASNCILSLIVPPLQTERNGSIG